jgi:hypothetical protein
MYLLFALFLLVLSYFQLRIFILITREGKKEKKRRNNQREKGVLFIRYMNKVLFLSI